MNRKVRGGDAVASAASMALALCAGVGRLARAALQGLLILAPLFALTACGGGGSAAGDPQRQLSISAQPVSQAAIDGSSVTFAVTASGSGIEFQWQLSIDGGSTWVDLPGATSADYTVAAVTSAMDGQQYRVALRAGTASAVSSAVTLTVAQVAAAPGITLQPGDQNVAAGADAAFAVTATGTALTYQWQESRDPATWTDLPGATQASLTVSSVRPAQNGWRYRVRLANAGGTVYSDAAVLNVSQPGSAPTIVTQPAAASVVVGQAAQFSVIASGTSPLAFQWQSSRDGGVTYADIASAHAATYATPVATSADDGTRFRVAVSNALGSVTSTAAVLSVTQGTMPSVSQQPADQFAEFGDNDFSVTTATFSASFAGTPTPSLQWQVSSDQGRTFANINGATGERYTTPRVTMADGGKRFRLVGSNAAGVAASSSVHLGVRYAGIGGEAWGIALRPSGEIVTLVLPFASDPWSRTGFGGLRQIGTTGRVTTLAGSDGRFLVDGSGPAAAFRAPLGVVLDSRGNAFVVDGTAVRRITPAGVVSTFAGSGTEGGFTDGRGTLARFGGSFLTRVPGGIAIDSADNLYIADTGNAAIRKITPDGDVTTLAGGRAGTDDGQGSAARFTSLLGITATPSGDLYAIDECRVRKITAGGLVSTFAGAAVCAAADGPLATATFRLPRAIAADPAGALYLSTFDGAVRKISVGGIVSAVTSTAPGFGHSGSVALAVDATGNLYIANGSQLIAGGPGFETQLRKVSPAGVVSVLP